ncbi:unnamed protein product [Alopecurus aequalis]
MLVATPMASEYGERSDNSGPWMCDPGFAIPLKPIPACKALVKLQCVASKVPDAVLRDCCQQLAKIHDWCRCTAVFTMMYNMYEELGVHEGQAGTEVFQGCRREVMELTVTELPAFCRVPIRRADFHGTYACI